MMEGVISMKHRACQTNEAKWLCLHEIYRKLYRPNFYDAGSTFLDNVKDYTFSYKTEQIGNQFLLHLFASNSHQANFSIAVSCDNDLTTTTNGRVKSVSLSPLHQVHKFKPSSPVTAVYITTYHFTEPDVSMLKDTELFIAVQFPATPIVNKNDNPEYSQIVLDCGIQNIKASHDLSRLLTDPIGYDFTIESMEGEKFCVHKLVLTTHSEFFKAMLKEGTAESLNNCMKLVDVPKKELKEILYFMYTGAVKDIESCDFKRLLEFADRYALVGLHQLSQHVLGKQLCEDNVFEILQLADTHNSASLKAKAFKFVKNNPGVVKSSTFQNVSYLDLMQELCMFLATS